MKADGMKPSGYQGMTIMAELYLVQPTDGSI
jgi:hypothetical protein